jgi:pimeloyl-ACP methyl ester carboxylesterase
VTNGRAVAFPILDGTFERRNPNYPDWGSIAGRDLVIRQMREMRRSIDYLETRADIDADAIAYYGHSWGGRLGPIAMAIEPRIKVGILNQAGLQHLSIPETNVLNFLPRVNVPVLQFNGRYDSDFRFESMAEPFFDLLGAPDVPKKHVVEPTGHFVSRPRVIGETLDWLDKYLGPVTSYEN